MLKARYLVAIFASLGFMASVQADPPWARGDGGHQDKQEKYENQDNDRNQYRSEKHTKYKKQREAARRDHFVADDRVAVRSFYAQNPSSLPPGLARRGGNLPPGLAKRGGNLPPGLSRGQVVSTEYEEHLLPLPQELEIRLPPPPHEVIRRILGHDIVMIDRQTKKVLDVMRDALPH